MKIAIIRSCDRDDLRAKLCYVTMLKHFVADKYIFFHDVPEGKTQHNCPLISEICGKFPQNTSFILRSFSDNFGGELNIIQMLKDLTLLPTFEDASKIIFCDSDIIMLKNPFEIMPSRFHYGGICNDNVHIGEKYRHFSGQFNIISGFLWKKYIAEGIEGYKERRRLLDKFSYSIADDSILSTFLWQNSVEPYNFVNDSCWLHHKITPEEYQKYLNL
jgi:hypothetical protein